ncbi:MAG: response regulator [Chloroflexi bacterium]|nr:response regulator [Chloroflexota bacterium]
MNGHHVPYKVLLIDDDITMRGLSETWLKAAGFDVLVAGDGEEGLTLFRSAKPDAVVTDIDIPGMDGFELCRRVRAESDAPVLVFSSRSEEEGGPPSLEAGAKGYVRKDLDLTDLIDGVRLLAVWTGGERVMAQRAALELRGVSADARISLSGGPVIVGRGADNDLDVNHRTVSRRHALIIHTAAGYVIRDLGSANGTWVNGIRVEHEDHPLNDGDGIRLGGSSAKLVFYREGAQTVGLEKARR